MANESILFDQTFTTALGDLRLTVDLSRVITDIESYSDKLLMARGIPFDIQNASPTDPMVILASQIMSWAEDKTDVVNMVRRHYDMHTGRARSDAAIIAFTRANPPFDFDPEPYPEPETEADWDVQSLPEPRRNLGHPLEKRLKQIMDMLASDITVSAQFYQAVQTIFVEVERRSRKTDDEGFPPGRSGRNLPKKAVAKRVQPQAPSSDSGLGVVSGRSGDPQPETDGRTPAEVAG